MKKSSLSFPALSPGSIPRWARQLFARTRQRARRGNLQFSLKLDDMIILWERCEGACAVSGLAFGDERFDHALVKRPFAPSLDRIDSCQGYTVRNTRLVCTAANFAMSQWGDEVLRRLSYGLVVKEREPAHQWRRRQKRRLGEYEKLAESMSGEELRKQKQRIAGLRRALTMGHVRLSTAAHRAKRTQRRIKAAR